MAIPISILALVVFMGALGVMLPSLLYKDWKVIKICVTVMACCVVTFILCIRYGA